MNGSSYTPEFIKDVLYLALLSSLEDDITVDHNPEANNYKISISKKGVAAGSAKAKETGDFSRWDKMVSSFKRYCSELKENVNNVMDAEAHVTMMILNDRDKSKVLLMITDGAVTYDLMKEKKQ